MNARPTKRLCVDKGVSLLIDSVHNTGVEEHDLVASASNSQVSLSELLVVHGLELHQHRQLCMRSSNDIMPSQSSVEMTSLKCKAVDDTGCNHVHYPLRSDPALLEYVLESKSHCGSVTVLDLPNELLIGIAELLPTTALFAVIILSRQLHCIVMPLLLSRHGLRPPVKGDMQECKLLSRYLWSLKDLRSIPHIIIQLEVAPTPEFSHVLDALRNTPVENLTLVHRSNKICKTELPLRGKRRVVTSSCLKVFRPHASLLFDTPFAEWTLETINCSDICELSLLTPGLISPSWNHVLEWLNISSLRILHVEGELSQAVLNRFMMCHPDVKELHIGNYSDCGNAMHQLGMPPPMLTNLHTLSAPIPYLIRLLGDPHYRITSLLELRILPDSRHDDPAQYLCNLSRILAAVVHCDKLWSLKCTIPAQLAAACEDPLYGGLGLIHDVNLHLTEVGYVVLEQASAHGGMRKAAFSHSLLRSLPSWLRQFPALSALQLWEDAALERSEEFSCIREDFNNVTDLFMWSGEKELSFSVL
ncbi:uncharacterized protein LAESUDRAFT_763693 [Laetiporus sulphureus 93-53]|uniref:F-box domain-containing protein n=1 Tax=Laetiporus sulphureus 93-53 TaxID=1314785 RepID=A0A165BPR6_9APHY|nr:uncharacterized protein LAESUDRAFT_763693 [Laetiporus sulphureus 93-53]KZT01433.1 hypothetical protein LAESUDRAFT_763693 [Laetiporus sulphureus 93-53]